MLEIIPLGNIYEQEKVCLCLIIPNDLASISL